MGIILRRRFSSPCPPRFTVFLSPTAFPLSRLPPFPHPKNFCCHGWRHISTDELEFRCCHAYSFLEHGSIPHVFEGACFFRPFFPRHFSFLGLFNFLNNHRPSLMAAMLPFKSNFHWLFDSWSILFGILTIGLNQISLWLCLAPPPFSPMLSPSVLVVLPPPSLYQHIGKSISLFFLPRFKPK